MESMDIRVENLYFLFFGLCFLAFLIFIKKRIESPVVYKYPLAQYLMANLPISSGFKIYTINCLRVLAVLSALMLACKVVKLEQCKNVYVNSLDIILVLDLSGSMTFYDDPKLDQRTRFQAARDVALDFIAKRENDQIGVIGFAKDAMTVSPLTLDKNMLRVAVSQLEIGVIDQNQTNISQALGLSLARLKDSTAKTKLIVLMTDGKPNITSELSINRAIGIAQEFGVKIYTVGVGDSKGAFFQGPLGFQFQPSEGVDVELLQEIASKTGGKFFQARKPKDLEAAYNEIDKMETSKVSADNWNNSSEYFWPFAITLVAALVGEFLLKLLWRGVW